MAGALPGPLQGYTVYEAAVLSKGSTDQAATAFVKYSAPAAAQLLPLVGLAAPDVAPLAEGVGSHDQPTRTAKERLGSRTGR